MSEDVLMSFSVACVALCDIRRLSGGMGKPPKRVFLDVSEDVLMSICVAGVALCDIRCVSGGMCVYVRDRPETKVAVSMGKVTKMCLPPHFSLHTLHSTLFTSHFTLHTPCFTLHTPHSTLYTPHFTCHTPHSTLSSTFDSGSPLLAFPSRDLHSGSLVSLVWQMRQDCLARWGTSTICPEKWHHWVKETLSFFDAVHSSIPTCFLWLGFGGRNLLRNLNRNRKMEKNPSWGYSWEHDAHCKSFRNMYQHVTCPKQSWKFIYFVVAAD